MEKETEPIVERETINLQECQRCYAILPYQDCEHRCPCKEKISATEDKTPEEKEKELSEIREIIRRVINGSLTATMEEEDDETTIEADWEELNATIEAEIALISNERDYYREQYELTLLESVNNQKTETKSKIMKTTQTETVMDVEIGQPIPTIIKERETRRQRRNRQRKMRHRRKRRVILLKDCQRTVTKTVLNGVQQPKMLTIQLKKADSAEKAASETKRTME